MRAHVHMCVMDEKKAVSRGTLTRKQWIVLEIFAVFLAKKEGKTLFLGTSFGLRIRARTIYFFLEKIFFCDAFHITKKKWAKHCLWHILDFNNIHICILLRSKKSAFFAFWKIMNKKINFCLTRGGGWYIILVACAVKCEVADTPIKVVITHPGCQVIHVEHLSKPDFRRRGKWTWLNQTRFVLN